MPPPCPPLLLIHDSPVETDPSDDHELHGRHPKVSFLAKSPRPAGDANEEGDSEELARRRKKSHDSIAAIRSQLSWIEAMVEDETAAADEAERALSARREELLRSVALARGEAVPTAEPTVAFDQPPDLTVRADSPIGALCKVPSEESMQTTGTESSSLSPSLSGTRGPHAFASFKSRSSRKATAAARLQALARGHVARAERRDALVTAMVVTAARRTGPLTRSSLEEDAPTFAYPFPMSHNDSGESGLEPSTSGRRPALEVIVPTVIRVPAVSTRVPAQRVESSSRYSSDAEMSEGQPSPRSEAEGQPSPRAKVLRVPTLSIEACTFESLDEAKVAKGAPPTRDNPWMSAHSALVLTAANAENAWRLVDASKPPPLSTRAPGTGACNDEPFPGASMIPGWRRLARAEHWRQCGRCGHAVERRTPEGGARCLACNFVFRWAGGKRLEQVDSLKQLLVEVRWRQQECVRDGGPLRSMAAALVPSLLPPATARALRAAAALRLLLLPISFVVGPLTRSPFSRRVRGSSPNTKNQQQALSRPPGAKNAQDEQVALEHPDTAVNKLADLDERARAALLFRPVEQQCSSSTDQPSGYEEFPDHPSWGYEELLPTRIGEPAVATMVAPSLHRQWSADTYSQARVRPTSE